MKKNQLFIGMGVLAVVLGVIVTGTKKIRADDITGVGMYRLYNRESGEHFYTKDGQEKQKLVNLGWKYEGIGWYAPSQGDPVYRLYNANAGDHHYTLNNDEKNHLVKVGWKYEGIGWYSADQAMGEELYRAYNPNAKAGSHNYTRNWEEQTNLINVGWREEGVAWYGIKQTNPKIVAEPKIYLNQGDQYLIENYVEATDFLGKKLAVSVEGKLDLAKPGIYEVKYNVSDMLNQKSSFSQTIVVRPKNWTPPVITERKPLLIYATKETDFDIGQFVTATNYLGETIPFGYSVPDDLSKPGKIDIEFTANDEYIDNNNKVLTFEIIQPTEQQLNQGIIPMTQEFFPDLGFRKLLEQDYGRYITNTAIDVSGITSMNLTELDDPSLNIPLRDLKGIEYFTHLTKLSMRIYYGKSINLSKNNQLIALAIAQGSADSIFLPSSIKDVSLDLFNLKDGDFSHLPNLKTMEGSGFETASLNFNGDRNLKDISIYSFGNRQSIESININDTGNIENITLQGQKVKSIDLTKQAKLKSINLANNDLTSIDLTKNTLLDKVSVSNNRISDINLNNNINLTSLNISNNLLSELVISNNSKLIYLNYENQNRDFKVIK